MEYEEYLLSCTEDRYQLSIYDAMNDFIKAQQCIKFYIHDYANADNVGKANENLYSAYSLTFPIKYCFGVNKTHEYSFLRERLAECSSITLNDVPEISYFNKESQMKKQIEFAFKNTSEGEGGTDESF